MKEITRIHLAQTPFNAELGAKKELEKYLHAIEKTLATDDDMLREIEARIVELLAERGVTGEKVVTVEDVEQIEEQLGAPVEFVDEQEPGGAHEGSDKHLMRDREKGMLGGVLAGIGAYTGVDPLWLRLAAVVLALASFGTAVVVYIVLWIVMPPAKTAADKLQMAGKPVTLGAIKAQSQAVLAETSERAKPLVVVLRVLLGVGSIIAALGAIGLVVAAGTVFGIRATPDMFSVVDPWLIVAFVLTAVSGLLLATLFGLLAYASFAWRFSRRMGVSVVAVIVAGLVLFSGAVGAGMYGGRMMQQNIQAMTRTEKVQLANLAGVKKLVTKNKDVSVEYRVTTGQPYAEMTIVSRDGKTPHWNVERADDTATLSVAEIKDGGCDSREWYGTTCFGSVSVVVYGPALESLESAEGQVEYRATSQPTLAATTHPDTTIRLTGGAVESVRAAVAADSIFDAQNTAVTSADVQVGRNASVELGVLAQLVLATPDSCAADSRASVEVSRVTQLKKTNIMTQQAEIRENCTTITIDEPNFSVVN